MSAVSGSRSVLELPRLDDGLHTRGADGSGDAAGLLHRRGHRLLDQDVLAGLDGLERDGTWVPGAVRMASMSARSTISS